MKLSVVVRMSKEGYAEILMKHPDIDFAVEAKKAIRSLFHKSYPCIIRYAADGPVTGLTAMPFPDDKLLDNSSCIEIFVSGK